ncbi:MAG: DNA topoisomerase IB, partial [Solirubrobacteraceae bacterium]|nr:DNA topoisomerase IB [Patulibacter sp.]
MARVRRSDPAGPGWSMRRRGKGFQLFDARGRELTGDASHDRVAALVIPPAWQDVWICPSPHGHIQATGVDAAGRRQYLYHEAWTASRSRAKFRRMSEFAVELDRLRTAVERDLDPTELGRAAVLAGLVRLLDIGFFRVGSERYASENRTFGLTTLLREHATVRRDGTIVFDYIAKHGKRRVQRASDAE